MRRYLLPAVLSLSLLLSTLVAAQDASYTFTTFDVPGATDTEANGINFAGQIVGLFFEPTERHGFLTSDGATFTTIDVPDAMSTFAHGINPAGQTVGWFDDTTRAHGFLTSDGATFTTLDVPGSTYTVPYGINMAGQIVGRFGDARGDHGFLTSDRVTFTTIGVPGATRTDAYGINAGGQIVGWFNDATGPHGFLTSDGATYTTLDVPGATFTVARGINDRGWIVGVFGDATGTHSFMATPNEVDMSPPLITASASPATLSPPNGKRVAVTVEGMITDHEPGGSGVKAGSAVYVIMDEYGQIQPSGSITLGEGGHYGFTVALEASRRGNDQDGRHYMILVSACSGQIRG